jgi:putative membrane protein
MLGEKRLGNFPHSVIPCPYNIIFLFQFLSLRRRQGADMTLSDWYFTVKALHVISVIAWMAGLFYLPRLYVYHVEQAQKGPGLTDTLVVMERRLLKAIMNPAMIATWVFGLMLVLMPGVVDWTAIWAWAKAASVIGMTVFHMWLGARRKDLAAGNNTVSGRTYRLMNEVPTVLMIVIVFAVIVKF